MKKLGAILLTCGLLSLPSSGFSVTDEEMYKLVQELIKEVKELKQENQYLKSEIERLKAQQKVEIKEVKKEVAETKEKLAKTKEGGMLSGFFSKGGYGAGKSKVDFYGYIKGDLIWQDSASVGTIYLLWALPKSKGRHDSTSTLTFRHSRFGLDLIKPYKDFTIKGKFEMDFYTESHNEEQTPWNPQHAPLRARLAYLEVIKNSWEFRVGHDWMTIAQLYPHLSNFPAGSYMGNLGYRLTQIRLTKNFKLSNKDLLKFQLALDKPFNFGKLNGVVVFDNEPNADFGAPGVEARVAYQTKLFDSPALFALFGHYSGQEYKKDYKSLTGAVKTTSFSTGLELRLPLPVLAKFKPTLSGEFWYGQGLGGYYTGAVGQTARIKYYDNSAGGYAYATDLTKFDKTADKIVSITPIHAVGGWVELGVKLTPKLQSWFGWGVDNPLNSDLKYVPGARLQQQMYYAHFLYRFVPELGTGFEYLRAITDYRKSDGDDGIVNRFMLSFYYFF
ncbi:hypothetical protein [Thermodesulfobacterium hydrogeniphilum]|uniref:hypothetical protein n=1 Tax=Thermodesulfobacterium hydrogeniphilum TaxID=161156 RepID=UPI0005717B8A|nr:hypothetical protein [Thermodesulfobacterium hydrogeniphilum]